LGRSDSISLPFPYYDQVTVYFDLAWWIREDVVHPDVMYQGCGGSPLQFNFKKKYRGYNSSNWSSFPKGWVILDVTYFIVHFAQDVAHVRTVIVIWIYVWKSVGCSFLSPLF